MLGQIHRDLQAARERDPAARSSLEVALLYPGLHAIWSHRFAHALWQRGMRFPARALSQAARWFTGIEIHPGAQIGPGLFIDHGMGVVIGETAQVGEDVMMYHGVTLGGVSLSKGKRHPTVGDRVTIGAGAKILGPIEVGHDAKVGANAVVVRSVPPHAVVVGVPGQVITKQPKAEANGAASNGATNNGATNGVIDLNGHAMPDVVAASLASLVNRVEQLETSVTGAVTTTSSPHHNPDGTWSADDFSI